MSSMLNSTLTPDDEAQLKTLADTALGLKAFMVEVVGYTDSTGSAQMNTKLSEDRAKAVIVFLMQQGNIPVRNIVSPGVMGEYGAKASNEDPAGRAENRRVEVKVLVIKARPTCRKSAPLHWAETGYCKRWPLRLSRERYVNRRS